jgi:ArsR family transcriptional regulator, arsenate/arsenite/antimonite-responsive transcriptional repressor
LSKVLSSIAIDRIGRVKELPLVECCTPIAEPTLSEGEAGELERLFRALADRHRLQILNCLLQAEGEPVCVCEFQPLLGIRQPTVSHHLKQLVEAGLLEREKRGTFAYYSLRPGSLERVGGLLAEQAAVPA